ncbi:MULTISPECIES: DoxX family protein [Paenibacillus]|uniref:DoxX family protein n=1 Tax=Paenibacillus TaxID=44249 RepID=UPI0022B85C42|nr:DoxX family protein [Paenibacillus caseinilyticus]MCZ8519782.1 DoxX family protein [Paenibacillus caseinilyticus]
MKRYEVGALILRVVLGLTFLIHGVSKFQMGLGNVSAFFDSMGLPGFMAYLVAVIELAGGAALILGIGTRVVSILLGLVMLGAILKVKLAGGFMGDGQGAGYELDLALLAMAAYLGLSGSSLYAVDRLWSRSESAAAQR